MPVCGTLAPCGLWTFGVVPAAAAPGISRSIADSHTFCLWRCVCSNLVTLLATQTEHMRNRRGRPVQQSSPKVVAHFASADSVLLLDADADRRLARMIIDMTSALYIFDLTLYIIHRRLQQQQQLLVVLVVRRAAEVHDARRLPVPRLGAQINKFSIESRGLRRRGADPRSARYMSLCE